MNLEFPLSNWGFHIFLEIKEGVCEKFVGGKAMFSRHHVTYEPTKEHFKNFNLKISKNFTKDVRKEMFWGSDQ